MIHDQRHPPILDPRVAGSLGAGDDLTVADLAVAHRLERIAGEPARRRQVLLHGVGAPLVAVAPVC